MVITARSLPRGRLADATAAGWLGPLALALLGLGLPTLAWRLLPRRTLQAPRSMQATRLPPFEMLRGRALSGSVRLVDVAPPAAGTLLLRLERPPSTSPEPAPPVRIHWALAPRGGGVEAMGSVAAPDGPGTSLTRRLYWTSADPYVLHLVAERPDEPSEVRVGVQWVATPPPWLETLLALLLGAPLVFRLVRLAVLGPTHPAR